MKTPGHTPGHQSILVRMETGKSYLFAGDVISLADNLKLKIPGSNTWNAQQSVESIYKLEHLSGVLDADIIPSHDMGQWSQWKKSPEPFS